MARVLGKGSSKKEQEEMLIRMNEFIDVWSSLKEDWKETRKELKKVFDELPELIAEALRK